jgi:hypothetical protein
MMSVEQSVEWELAEETEVLGENFVHYKLHMTWPEFEPGPPASHHGADSGRDIDVKAK